jgi:hypothetical protein
LTVPLPNLADALEQDGGHADEDGDEQGEVEGSPGGRVGLEGDLVQTLAPPETPTRDRGHRAHGSIVSRDGRRAGGVPCGPESQEDEALGTGLKPVSAA